MTGSSDRARDGILDQPKSPHEISKCGHAKHPSKEKEEENNLSGRFHLLLRVSLLHLELAKRPPKSRTFPPPPAFPAKVTSMSEMNYIALSPPTARSAGRSSPRFGCPISKQCGLVSKMR
ncbi:hypothetical protein CPAR01_06071 [Colletotrichum paranaense]|uniref:Uncharacterized protein n=1 Tax=Colletotrichum paranaense TaxID=1914294 RepID=A0ABQ9ST42_9PEZI|nr:uncharacterized protein CPAR01_06071 [Colletotrichum paranaense]KAK1542684.1 hypothetical protein CPAR01_06071 [Colletotrichum paranaense]